MSSRHSSKHRERKRHSSRHTGHKRHSSRHTGHTGHKRHSSRDTKDTSDTKSIKDKTLPTIKLKHVMINDNSGNKIHVVLHPYYRALQENNPSLYTKYVGKSRYQSKKESGTWEGFYNLYKAIKKKGYRLKDTHGDPILLKKYIKGNWLCFRGRHRMCIAKHLYDDETSFNLKKHTVVSVNAIPKEDKSG